MTSRPHDVLSRFHALEEENTWERKTDPTASTCSYAQSERQTSGQTYDELVISGGRFPGDQLKILLQVQVRRPQIVDARYSHLYYVYCVVV